MAVPSPGAKGLKLTTTKCRFARANTTRPRQIGTSINQPTILLTIALRAYGALAPLRTVEPLANFLASLELRHIFLAHIHLLAGTRIAPDAGWPVLHREGAKAAQFDAITARQSIADLIEDRIDDVLDIALEQMRIFRRKLLDKFRLDHPRLHLAGYRPNRFMRRLQPAKARPARQA